MPLALPPATARSFPALLALALLVGCASPPPDSAAGATSGADQGSAPPGRTTGTAVDSLNGVPTHRFGEPLRAFPGLQRGEGGGPLLIYSYPKGAAHDKSWFAKHRAEVPGVFYKFQEGQFAAFQAVAYSAEGQAALMQEARFLFGPGRQLGDRTEWSGTKAWAILHNSIIYGQPVKILEVNSHTLLDNPSAREQQRLRAENAQ